MGRKKTEPEKALTHEIKTRVNDQKYEELQALLALNSSNDMSRLVRDILHRRTIKVFTKDLSLDNLMEELSKLRSEIRAIGVNINQITKHFNTYPESYRKAFYAKIAFEKYQNIQPKIDELLKIISQLAKRWLSA